MFHFVSEKQALLSFFIHRCYNRQVPKTVAVDALILRFHENNGFQKMFNV